MNKGDAFSKFPPGAMRLKWRPYVHRIGGAYVNGFRAPYSMGVLRVWQEGRYAFRWCFEHRTQNVILYEHEGPVYSSRWYAQQAATEWHQTHSIKCDGGCGANIRPIGSVHHSFKMFLCWDCYEERFFKGDT